MTSRALAPALVVLGAAGIAGGALPIWWTVGWTHSMLGEQSSELAGRQVAPSLLALALVAIAGIGAVAAGRGNWRRVIGGLVAVVGLLAVVVAVNGVSGLPAAVIRDENLQVAQVLDGSVSLFGPVLAIVGGLVVTAGGVLVAAGSFAGRGMGARFERSPSAGSDAGAPAVGAGAPETAAPADPDESATALWKSLDSGQDPTAGSATEPADDQTTHPGEHDR